MADKLRPWYQYPGAEAGVDEAGRGCLAGPVVAAAVILPRTFSLEGLNDSKQLSATRREQLRQQIEEQALAWSVAAVDNRLIDEMNILRATWKAMHLAIQGLSLTPSFLLIDGKFFLPYPGIPSLCIIRGDSQYAGIAAASILAKTHRDRMMKELDNCYPQYGWKKNKGYPTRSHREALLLYGPSPWHRRSFRLTEKQIELSFPAAPEE